MTNAYHMCRFNYKASVQSDIFIRNLAGKIVKDVPELGNPILADDHALDYLEEYRCRQDPFLCLEIAIIAPLKHIQTDKKYLIIIDALDECDTPMGNDLYDLLAKKLNAIFEVLCAAANPIDLDELFLITDVCANKRRTFSMLLGNEFGHFLQHYDNKLSFQHKSLKEFLTNDSRKLLPFYINITRGHTLFTKHFLHEPTYQNVRNEKDLLDIASHVALTYNNQFSKTFLKLFNRTHLDHTRLLICMASEVNCYDTANLIIQLITQSGLSSSNMSNAAFIASSNGNFKTLISFHEKKVNLKSKYNIYLEHSMKGPELVHMCKFVFFCGYNVFHIAAQRGYVEIVEYLLNKYPDILYEQNSIHLNAFQLAAENGHTNIIELFLDIDLSLADQHSLYYASQQGHGEIVSLLLNYVNETCLPCNGTLYWLPALSFRKQNNITIPIEVLGKNSNNLENLNLSLLGQMLYDTEHAVLLDDWRLITCESALNAAVSNSNNFIKLVVFADKDKVHLNLNSKSSNGSTPYHSAAICKSLILSHYVDTSVRNMPDKVDNNNRSILHYGLMQLVSQEEAIQIDRVGKDYFSDLLFRVAINNKHDYKRVDMDGKK
ncbi:unnamed protein product [Mytilus edulis]|uniref:Nephrocystin 3-like N-terminal domain-containing protein n=1 Tax=Mytilus edulis TaxID=6550 RepID=A0A8S3VJB9_MYTED|nr:unnamed protein product [Mytilus edulis]